MGAATEGHMTEEDCDTRATAIHKSYHVFKVFISTTNDYIQLFVYYFKNNVPTNYVIIKCNIFLCR